MLNQDDLYGHHFTGLLLTIITTAGTDGTTITDLFEYFNQVKDNKIELKPDTFRRRIKRHIFILVEMDKIEVDKLKTEKNNYKYLIKIKHEQPSGNH